MPRENKILHYIKTHPVNVSELERLAGLSPRTLHNALNATGRNIRPDKWWDILRALCPVIIDGVTYTYDDDPIAMFIAECPAGNKEPDMPTLDKGNYFVYYPATYRSILDDDESFNEWFGLSWKREE